jgi:hypothetical protein
MDLDPLILAVLDLLLVLFEIALQDLNCLLLITDSILVVSLLACDIVLEDFWAPLHIVDDLL